jgi:hypothetical protein
MKKDALKPSRTAWLVVWPMQKPLFGNKVI